MPIVLLLIYSEINRKGKPLFYVFVHNVKGIWAYLAIVIVWWVVRNVLFSAKGAIIPVTFQVRAIFPLINNPLLALKKICFFSCPSLFLRLEFLS